MSGNVLINDNTILHSTNYKDIARTLFVNAHKCRSSFRVGTEHEVFLVNESGRPLSFNGSGGIESLLKSIAQTTDLYGNGFEPVYDADRVIALISKGSSITLEPGGQFELSGAQLDSLHDTAREIDWFHKTIKQHAVLGTRIITAGFHPSAAREDFSWVPKQRYGIMKEYMPNKGSRGLDMMLRTCTVQANLDYESEKDMIASVQTAFMLSPIVAALFVSSPFKETYATGALSERILTWEHTDPDRSGYPDFIFDDDFGYDKWIEYVLDVPMYFIRRNNQYINCAGKSFRHFIINGYLGHTATLSDFVDHLSTIFTEVRIKPYIEVRSADCGPTSHLKALPALWKGLLYDVNARKHVAQMMDYPSVSELRAIHHEVAMKGLNAEYRGNIIADLALSVVELSTDALKRQARLDSLGNDESIYLKPLLDIARNRQTFAEQWLEQGL